MSLETLDAKRPPPRIGAPTFISAIGISGLLGSIAGLFTGGFLGLGGWMWVITAPLCAAVGSVFGLLAGILWSGICLLIGVAVRRTGPSSKVTLIAALIGALSALVIGGYCTGQLYYSLAKERLDIVGREERHQESYLELAKIPFAAADNADVELNQNLVKEADKNLAALHAASKDARELGHWPGHILAILIATADVAIAMFIGVIGGVAGAASTRLGYSPQIRQAKNGML
jgi:hypothetical protein